MIAPPSLVVWIFSLISMSLHGFIQEAWIFPLSMRMREVRRRARFNRKGVVAQIPDFFSVMQLLPIVDMGAIK
ncbi:hypothetical protein [Paraburkholderia antibiotica]|uniref:Uncharacterized protein n=1 Tax=Paraburkholderia antibiotica TaxID=2728839 RepID=A0A7Y0A247_9BURK|nr:hypothetical protein [Paraburkholderia antibiotica]NML35094.1 hypothetical protein [Paraburkholderia antibiotica]